ncbi:hypothetical protein M0804_012200 [Polistes exclamans]|nr:hypothetical protein M0804_012200 [Polistes exclamans]
MAGILKRPWRTSLHFKRMPMTTTLTLNADVERRRRLYPTPTNAVLLLFLLLLLLLLQEEEKKQQNVGRQTRWRIGLKKFTRESTFHGAADAAAAATAGCSCYRASTTQEWMKEDEVKKLVKVEMVVVAVRCQDIGHRACRKLRSVITATVVLLLLLLQQQQHGCPLWLN